MTKHNLNFCWKCCYFGRHVLSRTFLSYELIIIVLIINFLLTLYQVGEAFWLVAYFDLEAAVQRCSVKKVFLEISQNSQENTCARVCNFIKKETLAQLFSCEFCEISKNIFFTEHLWWLLLLILLFQ